MAQAQALVWKQSERLARIRLGAIERQRMAAYVGRTAPASSFRLAFMSEFSSG